MTHSEKLNAILYLLLNEVTKSKPNPQLTFEFICKKVCEVSEDWEINFLRNTLIDDGFIFVNPIVYELPKITPKGIKFIQIGGYKLELENRELEKNIKIETLKNLKQSKLSLILGAIAIIISVFTGFSSYESSLKKTQIEEDLYRQKQTIDSVLIVLKNNKKKQNLQP